MSDKYVMLGGRMENVIFAKGKVVSSIKKGDTDLYSIDGIYYFKIDGGVNYKTSVADSNEFGEAMPFRIRPDLRYVSMDYPKLDADIYIDLCDKNKKLTEELVENALSRFKIESIKCVFNKGLEIVFENEAELKKFTDLLDFEPSRLNMHYENYFYGGFTVNVTLKGQDVDWYLNATEFRNYFEKLSQGGFFDYSEEDLVYHNNIGRKSFQWELWAMCKIKGIIELYILYLSIDCQLNI